MSNVGREGRSFKRITHADLHRLADIATKDLSAFFVAHPDWAAQYKSRLLGLALCQGAAKHLLYGTTGIQDFDVYAFFARHPARPWYARRNKHVDFGDPKFGVSLDRPDFVGRRVDLLGRSLDAPLRSDPADAIRGWLRQGRNGGSAAYLAQKAVVLLLPAERMGEIVWSEFMRCTPVTRGSSSSSCSAASERP
jgi:hypothetical protein